MKKISNQKKVQLILFYEENLALLTIMFKIQSFHESRVFNGWSRGLTDGHENITDAL
jgi:hypothetical protein